MHHSFKIILLSFAFFSCGYAAQQPTSSVSHPVAVTNQKPDVLEQNVEQDLKLEMNPSLISFYKPTYVLPFYYHYDMSAFHALENAYSNITPDGEQLKNIEMKYQFSFKVPVWQKMFGTDTTLYGAYTQLSFWQSYANSAFFRETNYEPEIFESHQMHLKRFLGWKMDFLNFGAIHESNGQGGNLERSWNRLYVKGIFSKDSWIITWEHWAILADSSLRHYNPDIGKYLGDGQITIEYQYQRQDVALEIRNIKTLTIGQMYPGFQLSWSFPLTAHLNGYLQVFSGYGESLIEYNVRANAFGLGIALTNWG